MGKVLCLLLILCPFVVTESKICTRTDIASYIAWDTRAGYVIETYRTYSGRCYTGCTKSRWRMSRERYSLRKTKLQIVKSCCDGYIELENSTSDGDPACQPICTPACKNANCIAPGQCECYPGYNPDPYNERNCIYTCPEGVCEHGTCSAPNTCDCNFGYSMVNQTCQPVCTNLCVNATCVAPETCECHFGYRKSESNTCEPYCSSGCENGTCVGPETCRCLSGYRMVQNSTLTNQSCSPVCSDPCHNGTCIAPDTCKCDSGYRYNTTGGCEPVCSKPCDNGTCVAPEICHCHSGYIKENHTCVPHCSNDCANGSCVAPDSCICDSGFQANTTTGECEPVCSQPCGNGTCVSPDTCECYPSYEWNSTCIAQCVYGCAGGNCVSPNVCQCKTDWEYKNGTCVPQCKHSCGNGTCVMPNVCRCFHGYHLDIDMLIKGSFSGPLCIPTCVDCTGTCVAPNKCLVETSTHNNNLFRDEYEYHYDDEDYNDTGSTVSDDLLPDMMDENETSNKTILIQETDGIADTQKISWIEQRWPIIVFAVLFIIIACIAILLAVRWKALRHYMKGRSYTVAGDNSDVKSDDPSQFVEVSFSSIDNKCRMEKP